MRALFQTWRLELRMVLSLLRQKKQWVPAGVDQLILRRFQTRSFDCDYFLCGVKCRVEITLLTALEDDVRANSTPYCVPCQIQSMPKKSGFTFYGSSDNAAVGFAHYSTYLTGARERAMRCVLNSLYGFMQPTSPFDCFLGPPALHASIPPPPPPPPLDFASLYPNTAPTPETLRAHFVREEREQARKEKREKRAHYQHKKK